MRILHFMLLLFLVIGTASPRRYKRRDGEVNTHPILFGSVLFCLVLFPPTRSSFLPLS